MSKARGSGWLVASVAWSTLAVFAGPPATAAGEREWDSAADGSPALPGMDWADRIEASADSLLEPLVEAEMVSGSVLIARGDEVLLAKGYGLADREHEASNTTSTPFRIASVSKSITAVAVLQLVEDGCVALETPLESLVPGFPNGDRITVEHLLGHRSGIPSDVYLEGFEQNSRLSLTLEDALAWVREEAQPRFKPGDRFDYSNSNYLLLTSVVEQVSGLPYEQYLAQMLFGPAGMSETGLDSGSRILPGRAHGYSRTEPGEVANAPYRDPSFGWGYGALYSTTWDLWRFDRALTDERLLSPEMRSRMWSPRSETPWGNQYGLGWFVDELDGMPFVAAVGSTGGFAATLRHFLGEDSAGDYVVVVLLNHDFLLYEELFDQLSRIALGSPWTPVLGPGGGPALESLSEMAGLYEMDDGVRLELRRSGNGLRFGRAVEGPFFEVHPLSARSGYVAAQNARLVFREGDQEEVELLALYGNLAWRGVRVGNGD